MGGAASTRRELIAEGSDTPITSWTELCQLQKPVEGSDEQPLHLRGISGYMLQALIQMPEFQEEWTTGDFCRQQVLPLTGQYKCSFVRLAETLRLDGRPMTGPPTRFLSHTWGYPIKRTICAALDSIEGGLQEYYWFDIFCLNQHSNEIGHPEFNTLLRNAMKQTTHTLFVCSPWNRPVSITRAWCLFEVMESLKPENEMTFTPVLDPDERADFTQALLEDTSALLEIFINVNARQASAFLKEDLDMILLWIETSIGLDEMNTVLKKGLCDWLRKAGSEAVDNRLKGLRIKMGQELRHAEAVDSVETNNVAKHSSHLLDEGELNDLKEEEGRLLRRKELLIEDLDRFDHVEPLSQVAVLDDESIEDVLRVSEPLATTSIPVLLGTTGHHAYEQTGGVCGGVLPAFLQLLVAQPGFRRDVYLGTDSKGQSRTSESRFHSELRNVCALWEKARDGIISLDMLIDKFPPHSMQLSLEPADFTEFVNVLLDENIALQDFWPLSTLDSVIWYNDEEGSKQSKIREERTQYVQAWPKKDMPTMYDAIKATMIPESIEDYHWVDDKNPLLKPRPITVQKCLHWKNQAMGGGRLAVMLCRIQLDYSTFQMAFNPALCVIPSELSMGGLEYQPTSDIDQTLVDDRVYRPRGIIAYNRNRLKNDDDTSMSPAVYVTYIEVNGQWWMCSEFHKLVRAMTWETVQEKTSKCAYMVLFDSNL